MFQVPPILWIILGIVAVVYIFVYVKYIQKVTIDWRSFLATTFPLDRGKFGVYCFTGHQGSGKTYSLVKYINENHEGKQIYSNIELKGIDYKPISSIEELLALADQQNCIIVYDEIFSIMSKSKKNAAMLEQFLPQMRKVKNIFLTTAQYWLELDVTFRRFVRIQVECETTPLDKLGGILHESYYNTEKIKWDKNENEFVSPLIATKISKYQAKYMRAYDTYQRVKTFKLTEKKQTKT